MSLRVPTLLWRGVRGCALGGLLTGALALAGCGGAAPLVPAGGFQQPLGAEHPLLGRVWSTRDGAFVDPEALLERAGAARVLLLGETHDNADHHRIQAMILDRFLERHPGAPVAFEMLDETQAPALEESHPSPDALARAVDWDATGWPDFTLYRPLFEAVMARGATLVAAHPSRDEVRASMRGVPAERGHALHLEPPLPDAMRRALEEEIVESHCGHAPPAMVGGMVRAQGFKDAFMAEVLAARGGPVALVAGGGHVRNDRGVPRYLARWSVDDVLSIVLMDVHPDATDVRDYEPEAYDLVVFTTRVSDESPCDRFRRQLESLRHGRTVDGAKG